MPDAAPNLVCRSCICLLRQASALKEMLHKTAIFWETFITNVPQIVETNVPSPVTVLIKEELEEDSLMQETIYLSSSYYQHDDDDKEETVLRTAESDVEGEFLAVDSEPEANLLKLPVKRESGFCEICYTGNKAL